LAEQAASVHSRGWQFSIPFIPLSEIPMTMRSWIRSLFTRPAAHTIRKGPCRARLYLETLEDRFVPSTFTVLNGADDGDGSLRAAIAAANDETTNPGPDTINFAAGVTAVTLTTGQLPITSDISITGPAAKVTIARDAAAPHFRIFAVAAGASAELSELTITGGNSDGFGSGLDNGGTATLTDCTVSGNSTGHGSGGGLANGDYFNRTAMLTLTNCTVSGNSTKLGGGGVINYGTATLSNCTVSDNTASISSAGVWNIGTVTLSNCTVSDNSALSGEGGGLNNDGTAMLALTSCTVSGNSADFGGGLFNNGMATLTNCTVSGNPASEDGGGLLNNGTATLTNCTVSGNSASRTGGGLWNSYYGTATLTNTIVAGQTSGHDITNGGGTITGSNNLIGGDPMLAPLANNGGPTQTMALLSGSPAINAGTTVGAPSTDQRGVARVGAVDIGAYESPFVTVGTTTTVTTANATYDGQPHGATAAVTPGSAAGTVTFLYTGSGTTNYNSSDAPKCAGTYHVVATFTPADPSAFNPSSGSADFTISKATLTGNATTQDTLNLAKQGQLTITISNVAGLASTDSLACVLKTASYYITIGSTKYEFAPTTVTTSGSTITITYSLKNSALATELATALAGHTSAATAVSAGFEMDSLNYTLSDDYLTRLFSSAK
jgi:hypothetical protein